MTLGKLSLDGVLLLFCILAGCTSAEQTLFNEGEEQLKNAQFAEAYDTFTSYIALYRGTVPVYYDRALASKGLGRIGNALEDLERVIRADPGDPDVRWMRYKLLVDHRKVLQDAQAAAVLAVRPMIQGLETIETLLMFEDLEKLLRLNAFDLGARSERASLLWGLGRLSEARADLDTILRQSPDDVWALNARGMLLHNLGEYASAVEDYDAALDMLGPRFETMGIEVLHWVKADPDLDPIRDLPPRRSHPACRSESSSLGDARCQVIPENHRGQEVLTRGVGPLRNGDRDRDVGLGDVPPITRIAVFLMRNPGQRLAFTDHPDLARLRTRGGILPPGRLFHLLEGDGHLGAHGRAVGLEHRKFLRQLGDGGLKRQELAPFKPA